jgi:glycerol-3-phosphate dehydrogenase
VVERAGGSVLDVRARHVVNATGVWADRLDPTVRLRPSRGTHLVLPAAALGHPTAAVAVPVPGHFGRVLFALPQPDGLVFLGLTDEPAEEVTATPGATPGEVEFLLDTFSEGLARPLVQADVLGTFSGLRPLLASGDRNGAEPSTADLSRRHAVRQNGTVITITGGKLTTYRRMAADVVDLLTDRPCSTHRLPLVGAGTLDRPTAAGLPPRLVRRFGNEAPDVARLAGADRQLLAPIAPEVPALGVEVLWALRAEGALDAADVLDGRLRLDLVPKWRAAAHSTVAELVDAVPVG